MKQVKTRTKVERKLVEGPKIQFPPRPGTKLHLLAEPRIPLKMEKPKVEYRIPSEVEGPTMEPKILAAKMGISPKRLRAMLRAGELRSGELKGKKWNLPVDVAREVEKEYKEKKAKAEAVKQAQIAAELKGEA